MNHSDSIRKPLNSMIAKVAEGAAAETDVLVETSHDIRRILKGTEAVATGAVTRAKDTAAYLRKINAMTKKLTPVLKHAVDVAQVRASDGARATEGAGPSRAVDLWWSRRLSAGFATALRGREFQ